ncbi:Hypothetical protein SRAE_1000159200 [Strongyloides ratti]|uniref:Uncharacterized protein n=1 Tax=Strongyloides ratti TaxID=34506 RepID=A0A090L0N1_STRRB|nr:Hypothetical protein SRAE_1000159200 [Strongyloides ratti]CEF63330.1 Hypothetical protein SRAE_1000159200 [Strongyloides ratti]
MNTSRNSIRSVGRKSISRSSRSLSTFKNRLQTSSKNGRLHVTSTEKKSQSQKRRFKASRSASRSTSRSGFTSKTMSEFSNSSCANIFGLENIMNKIFKSKIFVCADQCYTFDGINGILVSYKFVIASEGSPFFIDPKCEVKPPIALYESTLTPHVIREEYSKNANYGNSKIILQIFQDYVIYKRDIQIPYLSLSNSNIKEILSNKVRIEYLFKKFSNNSYKLDDETLEWPEEISTYVVNSDLKRYGHEIHFKDVMEIWFGINRFEQSADDYNVATFTYREKEAFHRSSFDMKTGESCAKISRKLVFPTSMIGETFEIAYTKEFFMNYVNGKWIRENENKFNKNNSYLLSDMSNFTTNGNLSINNISYDVKETPRYRYKSSNILSNRHSIKDIDTLNTTNIPGSSITLNNSFIPLSHSTPLVINTQSTKKINMTTSKNDKLQSTKNSTTPNYSKSLNSPNTLNKDNESLSQNIYYSMISNDNSHNTSNKQSNDKKNLNISATIDKIFGDVTKHASNLVDIAKNQTEVSNNTSIYYSGNDETLNMKSKVCTPKLNYTNNDIKSPIVFKSEPTKDSPLKQLFDNLDITQNSSVSHLSINLEDNFNKVDSKNKILSMPSDNNSSGNLSLNNGKSLSTIKEMSLEQGQSHSNPSKSTISIFSTKPDNNISAEVSKWLNIDKQNSEIVLPLNEKMSYVNSSTSSTSLSNSSSKDIEEDITQDESKELSITQYTSPVNKFIFNLNKNQDDSLMMYKNFQSPISANLSTAVSIATPSQNISLNNTQDDSRSSEFNNSLNLQPITPINITPDKCIIMKSVVRDLPDIKRPKTPASLGRQIVTPIRTEENQVNDDTIKQNLDRKSSNHNITVSYLQTSRILQTPASIKRTNSAFGLRGINSQSSIFECQNNETSPTTPKKNLYRTLSATPTKRCRSSSYNVLPVNNLENQITFENEIFKRKENDENFSNKSKHLRRSSVSPLRSPVVESSMRLSRNIDIKKTPNSVNNKRMENNFLLKTPNSTNISFDNNKKTDNISRKLDIGTSELINNLESLSLQKIETSELTPIKLNMKYTEHNSSSNIIDKDIKCPKSCTNQTLKIETLVTFCGELKKLTHTYTFDNLHSPPNIKVLSLNVDGKNFYKSNELYNIDIHN